MNIVNELRQLGWSDDLIGAAENMAASLENQAAQTVIPHIEAPRLRTIVHATHSFTVRNIYPASTSSLYLK
jgi:hypothetical protein